MKTSQKTKEKPKEKSVLKLESSTQDFDNPNIQKRIIAKRNRLYDIHASIAVYGMNGLTYAQKAKGNELEDRLQFRIQEAEEKLLDDKIDIYQELLRILKK